VSCCSCGELNDVEERDIAVCVRMIRNGDECQCRRVYPQALMCSVYHRVVSKYKARREIKEEPKQTYRVSSADEVLDADHQACCLLGLLFALLGTTHCCSFDVDARVDDMLTIIIWALLY